VPLQKEILETIKWSTAREPQKGGQHCGMPNYGIKLTSEEMGFEITLDGFRSQMSGKQFAMLVFELYCEEISKNK
jgi:protein subunit release factor A